MATIHIVGSRGQGRHGSGLKFENPRKAATKVKEVNFNLQMMKKRLLVLKGQEEYNRYKTLDHQKRIHRHQQLHQIILRDQQLLRKSLEKVQDIEEVKEKTEQIRQQLKHKIAEARNNLIGSRTQRSQRINDESIEIQNRIREQNLKSSEDKRQKRHSIQEQEQQTRDSIISHIHDKIRRIKLNKAVDADFLSQTVAKGQQQISKLAAFEQQLIQKNSQSLQASQVMRRRYNEIFTSSSNSSGLPEIRTRTNNSKYSSNTAQQYQ